MPNTPETPLTLSEALNCPTHMVVDVYRWLEREGYIDADRWHRITHKGAAIGLGVNRRKAYPLFYPSVIEPLVPRTVLVAGLETHLLMDS